MNLIKKIADNTNRNSLSHRFRQKRFELLLSIIDTMPKPLTILDIGGTTAFWKSMGFKQSEVFITLLNLDAEEVTLPGFISLAGNAIELPYPDKSFDIVFSNSVIEHLYNFEQQMLMAKEVQRVGNYHFVQTPNYWFPIEPHWVFPLFQYFPFKLKVWLTRHFSLGHIPRKKDRNMAEEQVRVIRLLTYQEMKTLFPISDIYTERFCLFSKSFVAYRKPVPHTIG